MNFNRIKDNVVNVINTYVNTLPESVNRAMRAQGFDMNIAIKAPCTDNEKIQPLNDTEPTEKEEI